MSREFTNIENEYLQEMDGREFRSSGLLWFVNTTLHLFGTALTVDMDTGELKACYTKFRGFSEENNDVGYQRVSEYLKKNIEDIERETRE